MLINDYTMKTIKYSLSLGLLLSLASCADAIAGCGSSYAGPFSGYSG